MGLLYGEGKKAFQRLQKEIIAQTDDQSILTHKHASSTSPFAGHPSDFALSYAVENIALPAFSNTQLQSHPFRTTNKGVELRAAFIKSAGTQDIATRIIALGCFQAAEQVPFLLEIERAPGSSGRHWFVEPVPPAANRKDSIKEAEAILQEFVANHDESAYDPFEYKDIILIF
jgi:hypothetical protein